VDIDALPPGETALVDANIFIYHLSNSSAQCSRFLRRLALGEVVGCVTTVILAEVLHRRMVAEALTKGLISAGQPLKKLKANPSVIRQLTDYVADVGNILLLPLQILTVMPAGVAASHALRQAHGLFVNDSINLACALRHAVNNVVTHDADFNRAPLVAVWEPVDV
jgi:predicted nucleic acid-binding protein